VDEGVATALDQRSRKVDEGCLQLLLISDKGMWMKGVATALDQRYRDGMRALQLPLISDIGMWMGALQLPLPSHMRMWMEGSCTARFLYILRSYPFYRCPSVAKLFSLTGVAYK